jgi:hypothetical protein
MVRMGCVDVAFGAVDVYVDTTVTISMPVG